MRTSSLIWITDGSCSKFESYMHKRFDQAIITRGADEEREEGQV